MHFGFGERDLLFDGVVALILGILKCCFLGCLFDWLGLCFWVVLFGGLLLTCVLCFGFFR